MTSNEGTPAKFSQVTQNIKDVKYKCAETYEILCNNIPLEMRDITANNMDEKTLCYVDGVRAEIEAAEIPILTDEDTLTCQFLAELKDNCSKVDDLIAFKRGLVQDLEDEIGRYKNQIKIAHEAKKNPKPQKTEVKPEHVQKAKEKFTTMRKALRHLIQSIFPDEADTVTDMLGSLMQLRSMEGSSKYAEITPEMFLIAEALRDMGILTVNPYNKKEVKIAF